MAVDLTKGHTPRIIAAARDFGCLRNQTAYLLATARWETAHTMQPVEEAYWMSETWRKENLRYYPWHGRGFVQLTWARNYLRAGQAIDVDLTTDPDKAMEPDIAARILVIGCMEGWFTGKKIPDYITLQRSDFVGARRVVNGTDKAHQIAKLAQEYDALLKAAGYGVEPAAPAAPPAREIEPQGWLAALLGALRSIFGKDKA